MPLVFLHYRIIFRYIQQGTPMTRSELDAIIQEIMRDTSLTYEQKQYQIDLVLYRYHKGN